MSSDFEIEGTSESGVNVPRKSRKSLPKSSDKDSKVKRARSAFTYFAQEQHPLIRQANPEATFAEIGKIVGQKWKELDQKEKERFQEKARVDRERFEEESDKPKKPKKSPSGFAIFSDEKRAEVKTKNPEASFGEMGKILGAMWRNLADSERQVYLDGAAEAKARQEKKNLQ